MLKACGKITNLLSESYLNPAEKSPKFYTGWLCIFSKA